MKLILRIIICIVFYSKILSGAITGFQIGLHNLIDVQRGYRTHELNRTGMMIGFIFPVNPSDDFNFNFRMKLANHPSSYNENLIIGSNEFLFGKRIQVYGLKVLPQMGFGFELDYFEHDGDVRGNFFYDLSIDLLSVFNREALGFSLNFENILSGRKNNMYPNRRLSITALFFY